MILSGDPAEGELLGTVRPRPLQASCGVLVSRRRGNRLLQTGWLPPGKPELSEFLHARGEIQDIAYASVRGWRLLDIAVPAIGRPAGVALDVGGDRPVFFPPLAGIVPDAAALDVRGGD